MSGEKDRQELLAEIARFERASRALDPGATKRKRLRLAIISATERYLRRITTVKAYEETESKGAGLLDSPIGEHGIGIEEAIALLEEEVVKPGGHPASGGHMPYIPGGGLYHSALGDFYAAVTNKYAGIFFSAPGAVRMENMLVQWVAQLVGYPATASGNIASGGSIANLTAIATARDAHGLKGANLVKTVVYLTTQTHHSVQKALRLSGLAEVQLRYIPVDERFRLNVAALAEAIALDRANGLTPWLIVAAAGATDTGAVDPLDRIADVAQREQCWLHVDAAYGGFFLLTRHGREIMKGIERSDSVVLDPHKSLFLPYGSGIVLVRDAAKLMATNHYFANYMQDATSNASEVSPADLSPELTKHFRALRMWLPLIQLGVAPFRASLEEKLLLARYFRESIAAAGFEVGPEPDLTVVTYRWVPMGASLEETNRINLAIAEGSRHDGRVFLTSTMLDGKFTLRLVPLVFRTHRGHIDTAVKVLREQVATVSA